MRNWIVRVVHISEKQEDIQSEDGQGRQLMGKTLHLTFCSCILNHVFSHSSNRCLELWTVGQVKILITVTFHFKGSSNVSCSASV